MEAEAAKEEYKKAAVAACIAKFEAEAKVSVPVGEPIRALDLDLNLRSDVELVHVGNKVSNNLFLFFELGLTGSSETFSELMHNALHAFGGESSASNESIMDPATGVRNGGSSAPCHQAKWRDASKRLSWTWTMNMKQGLCRRRPRFPHRGEATVRVRSVSGGGV